MSKEKEEKPTPPDVNEVPVKEPDKKPETELPGKEKPPQKVQSK